MAKSVQTIITLSDGLDGGKAERTITFSVDGASYEIDLSKKNAAAFERALKPYVQAGRKVRGGASRRPASTSGRAKSATDLGVVRDWARANGYEVSDRGRVARSIQDAYAAAH